MDLDFGVEDWVAEAALFALIADAYRESALRGEGVTIEESLAQLMLVTPNCRADRTCGGRGAGRPRAGRRRGTRVVQEAGGSAAVSMPGLGGRQHQGQLGRSY
ncbi:hypothetical protein [Micromonospora sp. DT62]|uniref:hypothetical protein n=1 Tax=Micromonospora sp. DT62 TaxID=3416521 RepID=UPI003CF76222